MFLKKKPGNNPVTRAGYGGCLRKPQGGAGPRLRHQTGSPLVGRRRTNGRLMADQWRTALRPPIDFLAGPASAKPPVNASINSSSWICINYANTVLASWTPISSAVALQGKRLRAIGNRAIAQTIESIGWFLPSFFFTEFRNRTARGGARGAGIVSTSSSGLVVMMMMIFLKKISREIKSRVRWVGRDVSGAGHLTRRWRRPVAGRR